MVGKFGHSFLNEATTQNSVKVPKIVKPTNKTGSIVIRVGNPNPGPGIRPILESVSGICFLIADSDS